ncbi:hypothetical protein K3495_g4399 [Podosphaera aphanis]|nr:hypothetical protein K3495_g4399 [Podosphaera aphanis]
MDFASLMSKAISDARPATGASEPSKKYLKRSELEAERRAQYLAEQRAIEAAKAASAARQRQLEDDETAATQQRLAKRRKLAEESRQRREEQEAADARARRKRLGLSELVASPAVPPTDELTEAALTTHLRALGAPSKLFGETHKQRLRRLRTLDTVWTTGIIPTTLALVPEHEMKVERLPSDPEGRHFLFRQLASYFTMVMTAWNAALENEKSETFASKAAHNALRQSKESMVPLFRKFEKGDLDEGILEPIVEIVKAAQERRYVDANDGYLRLSIGKAAWPIGVTMVGIHERSAREKLHENDKGHVMGDEVTRKFLQSIKRCLSFAQTRWPPEDVRQLMG